MCCVHFCANQENKHALSRTDAYRFVSKFQQMPHVFVGVCAAMRRCSVCDGVTSRLRRPTRNLFATHTHAEATETDTRAKPPQMRARVRERRCCCWSGSCDDGGGVVLHTVALKWRRVLCGAVERENTKTRNNRDT